MYPSVSVLHDELSRKAWASKVCLKLPGFSVEGAATVLDKDLS